MFGLGYSRLESRGAANHLLESAGFSAIPWLENGNTALIAVIIVTVWQAIGWTMLFYISALNKILSLCMGLL
ncbi:hypothetical protein O9929_15530 [Vibrio lentus]|nr:hypothetical protein [Vibrio lentus]